MDHGGARYNEMNLIDFSYSSNPYKPPFIFNALKKAKLDRYPYCEDRLEEGIKEKFGIRGEVAIAAGITEQLYIIFNIFRNKSFVIPKFTYGEYERVAKLTGVKYRTVDRRQLEIEDLKIFKDEVLLINNPNNPTGKYYNFMQEIIDDAGSIGYFVVIDEAFIDFVGSSKRDVQINDNTIIMRSFSKSYNLSGVRIGYAISGDRLTNAIRDSRMPWGIGSLGCSIIEEIIADNFFLENSLVKIFRERERIKKRTGLNTHTNYFLAKVGNGSVAKEKLKNKGLLVRDCTSFGFSDSIRFSIRTRNDNEKIMEALEDMEVGLPDGIEY